MRKGDDGFIFELAPRAGRHTGPNEHVIQVYDEETGEEVKLIVSRRNGGMTAQLFDASENCHASIWVDGPMPWEKEHVAPGLTLEVLREMSLVEVQRRTSIEGALRVWKQTWMMEEQNSLSPWFGVLPTLGSWRLDPRLGEFEILVSLDPAEIINSEPEDSIKYHATYKHYLLWAHHGITPPPIQVFPHVDDRNGKLRSTNRRRLLAAQEAGRKSILAWFSATNSRGIAAWQLPNFGKDEVAGAWKRLQDEFARAEPIYKFTVEKFEDCGMFVELTFHETMDDAVTEAETWVSGQAIRSAEIKERQNQFLKIKYWSTEDRRIESCRYDK